MESRIVYHCEFAGILVLPRNNHFVRKNIHMFASGVIFFPSSILMPWVTVRKVKVDVEVVRAYYSCSVTYFNWPDSLRQE